MYIYQNKWTKWLSRVEFSQRFCQGIHQYTFRYFLRSLPLSWCLFFYCNQRKFQSFSPLLFDISCKIWPNWIVIISSATFWDLCNFSDDIDCSTKRSVCIFLCYLLIYPLKFDQINCSIFLRYLLIYPLKFDQINFSIFLRYFLIFPPLLWCYCLDMNLTKQIEVFCSATFGNLCHFPDAFVWVQPNKVSFFSATFLYIL